MSSAASHPAGSSDAAAALKGASLAFQNKKTPSTPEPARHKDNGALTAATQSAASRSRSPSRGLVPQGTGNSAVADVAQAEAHGFGNTTRLGAGTSTGNAGFLQARVDPKSPSFIAATLAASRSASPSPLNKTPRRRTSVGGASTSGSDVVDSLSIAPTNSLISMFERGKDGDPVKRRTPKRVPTASSDEGLPETWQGPVKLPGIGDSRYSPARSPMASDESLDQRLRAPMALVQGNPQLRPKPTLSKNHEEKSPAAAAAERQQRLADSAHSPPPKLQFLTKPTVSSARLSQVATDAPTAAQEAITQPSLPSKPKPKPQVPPSKPLQAETRAGLPVVMPAAPKPSSSPLPKPKSQPAPLTPHPKVIKTSTPEVLSPKPTRPVKPALQVVQPSPVKDAASSSARDAVLKRAPTPPKPRGSNRVKPEATSTRFVKSESPTKSEPFIANRPERTETMSTDDSFVSASSHQSGERDSPPPLPDRRERTFSAPGSPVRGTPRPRHNNPASANLDLKNMTSAIMAGSLASARLTPQHTGSSLPPPPLPQRQKSPRLRATMRNPASNETDEEEHKHRSHKHKLSRGKHAHHEGSRKKWRDQITPRERKRYEAIWASNRGHLLPPSISIAPTTPKGVATSRDTSELVVNVIVRELWRRSRLPEDELAEVWDLVDREKRGWLGRQEFVVGMWLIDQRLKGRKIPQKVSDSVWGSANGVGVIKHKHKGK